MHQVYYSFNNPFFLAEGDTSKGRQAPDGASEKISENGTNHGHYLVSDVNSGVKVLNPIID